MSANEVTISISTKPANSGCLQRMVRCPVDGAPCDGCNGRCVYGSSESVSEYAEEIRKADMD